MRRCSTQNSQHGTCQVRPLGEPWLLCPLHSLSSVLTVTTSFLLPRGLSQSEPIPVSRKHRRFLGPSYPRILILGSKEGSLTSAGPDAWGLDVMLGSLQEQGLKLSSQFWAQ